MGIKEIFAKLKGSSSIGKAAGRKLTANEVELASYKERERLDKVKKDLFRYRNQNTNEAIIGKKLDNNCSILKAKNVFAVKQRRGLL